MIFKCSWLGIASAAFYVGISVLSYQFNWGEGYQKRPILEYLFLYVGVFAIYFLVVTRVIRNSGETLSLRCIIFFGLLFRVIILPTNQIQEDDIYRYLWDGKVFANGVNPYKFSPNEISEVKKLKIKKPEQFSSRYGEREKLELDLLYSLKWENDRSVVFMERINHPNVPTIYPPFTQIVFRVVHQIKQDSIITMRSVFLVFDILALIFIVMILKKLGKNQALCIIYFWSPLVIKETFNSTHLDIIGISLMCGSFYFLICFWRLTALVFLALGTMSKFYPVILLPIYIRGMIQNRSENESLAKAWTIVCFVLIAFGVTCAILYWPFLDTDTKTFDGLKTFTTFWQNNESLFSILVFFYRNIIGLEQSFSLGQEALLLSYDLPTFLAKLTVLVVLGVSILWLTLYSGAFPPEKMLRFCFIVMSLLFLLSPVQNPWYLNWVIPFLCFFPIRAWIFLSGLIGFYYLDFYLDYQNIQGYGFWVILIEYLPFYMVLILDFLKNLKRTSLTGKKYF